MAQHSSPENLGDWEEEFSYSTFRTCGRTILSNRLKTEELHDDTPFGSGIASLFVQFIAKGGSRLWSTVPRKCAGYVAWPLRWNFAKWMSVGFPYTTSVTSQKWLGRRMPRRNWTRAYDLQLDEAVTMIPRKTAREAP